MQEFIKTALFALGATVVLASSTSAEPIKIASNETKRFEFKEGFERRPKDVINTLQDNEVTRFQTMLEGLDQAYDLDDTLKGKGPWTLFAPSDKAFKKIPQDD
ncbi:MAG TPA: fasciclin domain-containing protein, partial [Candidatus Melainabacteria bacterium]|nr:fasciclin domain-containing protein [Candidatus Melainabacteria bacterium]